VFSPTNFGDQKTHPFFKNALAFFSFLLAYFSWWSNYVEFTSVFVAMVYSPHFGGIRSPFHDLLVQAQLKEARFGQQAETGGNSFWTGWMKLFRL